MTDDTVVKLVYIATGMIAWELMRPFLRTVMFAVFDILEMLWNVMAILR